MANPSVCLPGESMERVWHDWTAYFAYHFHQLGLSRFPSRSFGLQSSFLSKLTLSGTLAIFPCSCVFLHFILYMKSGSEEVKVTPSVGSRAQSWIWEDPREENGTSLQDSLENSMDWETLWAQTMASQISSDLRVFTFTFHTVYIIFERAGNAYHSRLPEEYIHDNYNKNILQNTICIKLQYSSMRSNRQTSRKCLPGAWLGSGKI